MSRVNRGSTNSYRKSVQEGQVIPLHNYSAMQIFEINVLKVALTPDMQEEEQGLPSWIFFRDFTGIQPAIVEENMLGEFNYDVYTTVEENIVNFYMYQLQNGIPINTNTTLLANTGITPEAIQQMVINAENLSANATYQSIKNAFISSRTKILIDYADIINVKESQTLNKPYTGEYKSSKFVSGTVPPKDECPEIYSKYTSLNYLTSSMIKKKIELERPGVSFDTDEGKKMIGSWMGEFKPVDKPNTEGVIYMVESVVDTANKPLDRVNRLVAYDIRKSNSKGENKRLQSIEQVPKDSPGVDMYLDYLQLKLLYTTSTDKKEAGKDKKFIAIDRDQPKNLTPNLVYPLFKRVLFSNCASLVNKWKPFNTLQADEILREWLEGNMNYIEMLPIEEIDRNRETLAQLLPNSGFAEQFKFADEIGQDNPLYAQPPAQSSQASMTQQPTQPAPAAAVPAAPAPAPQAAPAFQPGTVGGEAFQGFMNQIQSQRAPQPTAPVQPGVQYTPQPTAQPGMAPQDMTQPTMPSNAINVQAPASAPNPIQQPVQQPEAPQPAAPAPAFQPGIAQPGMQQPGFQPGVQQAGMAQPGVQPGMQQAGFGVQPGVQPQ